MRRGVAFRMLLKTCLVCVAGRYTHAKQIKLTDRRFWPRWRIVPPLPHASKASCHLVVCLNDWRARDECASVCLSIHCALLALRVEEEEEGKEEEECGWKAHKARTLILDIDERQARSRLLFPAAIVKRHHQIEDGLQATSNGSTQGVYELFANSSSSLLCPFFSSSTTTCTSCGSSSIMIFEQPREIAHVAYYRRVAQNRAPRGHQSTNDAAPYTPVHFFEACESRSMSAC